MIFFATPPPLIKTLGYESIVIDHHNPVEIDEKGVTSVDKYLVGHLNPYKHALDSKTSFVETFSLGAKTR
ncbi:MAG: hypothetical protein EBT55_03240 [Proteobacteria bacterium]|nr:hypothetical protein [Pseudomonadota bacterium]